MSVSLFESSHNELVHTIDLTKEKIGQIEYWGYLWGIPITYNQLWIEASKDKLYILQLPTSSGFISVQITKNKKILHRTYKPSVHAEFFRNLCSKISPDFHDVSSIKYHECRIDFSADVSNSNNAILEINFKSDDVEMTYQLNVDNSPVVSSKNSIANNLPIRKVQSKEKIDKSKSSITNIEPYLERSAYSLDRIQKSPSLNSPEVTNLNEIEISNILNNPGIQKSMKSSLIEKKDSPIEVKSLNSPEISNLIGQFKTESNIQDVSSSDWSLNNLEYYDLLKEYILEEVDDSLYKNYFDSSRTSLVRKDSERDKLSFAGNFENPNEEETILLSGYELSANDEFESMPYDADFEFEEISFDPSEEEILYGNNKFIVDNIETGNLDKEEKFYEKTSSVENKGTSEKELAKEIDNMLVTNRNRGTPEYMTSKRSKNIDSSDDLQLEEVYVVPDESLKVEYSGDIQQERVPFISNEIANGDPSSIYNRKSRPLTLDLSQNLYSSGDLKPKSSHTDSDRIQNERALKPIESHVELDESIYGQDFDASKAKLSHADYDGSKNRAASNPIKDPVEPDKSQYGPDFDASKPKLSRADSDKDKNKGASKIIKGHVAPDERRSGQDSSPSKQKLSHADFDKSKNGGASQPIPSAVELDESIHNHDFDASNQKLSHADSDKGKNGAASNIIKSHKVPDESRSGQDSSTSKPKLSKADSDKDKNGAASKIIKGPVVLDERRSDQDSSTSKPKLSHADSDKGKNGAASNILKSDIVPDESRSGQDSSTSKPKLSHADSDKGKNGAASNIIKSHIVPDESRSGQDSSTSKPKLSEADSDKDKNGAAFNPIKGPVEPDKSRYDPDFDALKPKLRHADSDRSKNGAASGPFIPTQSSVKLDESKYGQYSGASIPIQSHAEPDGFLDMDSTDDMVSEPTQGKTNAAEFGKKVTPTPQTSTTVISIASIESKNYNSMLFYYKISNFLCCSNCFLFNHDCCNYNSNLLFRYPHK
ncbi:hypothetical protein HZS_1215 [Henneguya salminicola]|nr:hypothetical protein HZS_1215 [Henneguya salminicola]